MALAALIQNCASDVAPSTMRAIVKVESGGHPWVVNSNTGKRSYRPGSHEEAARLASALIARGESIDMGLAQINSKNLRGLGLTPYQVFEPCTNLRAGANVLREAYVRSSKNHAHKGPGVVLQHALSRYNTGDEYRGLRNGYVQKVFAAATGAVSSVRARLPPASQSRQAHHGARAPSAQPYQAPAWTAPVSNASDWASRPVEVAQAAPSWTSRIHSPLPSGN